MFLATVYTISERSAVNFLGKVRTCICVLIYHYFPPEMPIFLRLFFSLPFPFPFFSNISIFITLFA